MRLLLSSDWQTAPGNLEECEIAHGELLAAIEKYGPDAVINLGDFKQAYSPIDGLVVNFWVRAAREISERVPFYALMGNHDRYSQSPDTQNWMAMLAAAGAKSITEPIAD